MVSEVTDSKQDNEGTRVWYWILGILTLLILVFGIFAFYFTVFFEQFSFRQENFAQFGDFVGGTLNPFLGFATVALLVWSINVQMKELRLTREEIAATKDEAAMSRRAMEAQVEHFEKEAKLNELMRLISSEQDKYSNMLSTPIRNQYELRKISRLNLNNDCPMRCCDLLSGEFAGNTLNMGLLSSIRGYIKNIYDNKGPDAQEWMLMEITLVSIGHLIRTYLDINDSNDFGRVYLFDILDSSRKLCKVLDSVELKAMISHLEDLLNNYHSNTAEFTNPR